MADQVYDPDLGWKNVLSLMEEATNLRAQNAAYRKALEAIATYYQREYREGDKAYQAAIIARKAIDGGDDAVHT